MLAMVQAAVFDAPAVAGGRVAVRCRILQGGGVAAWKRRGEKGPQDARREADKAGGMMGRPCVRDALAGPSGATPAFGAGCAFGMGMVWRDGDGLEGWGRFGGDVGKVGMEDAVSYRHDRALAAVKAAEERYAIEEWKKGKLICPWCGQSLEPKAGFPDQVFVAEMARRMADDPQAWSALVYDCGQPGMKLEELAKLLKCSVPTASRARGRARELAKGMGMGSLCGHATPRLRGRRRDGGAKVLSEGVGRVG